MKVIVSLLLVVLSHLVYNVSFAQNRIVGGNPTAQGKLPFMALLWFDDDGDGFAEPFCAGTLIDSQWILSAAHCFVDDNADRAEFPERLGVSLGIVDINGGVSAVSVSTVIVHPDYNAVSRAGDIALLQLSNVYDGVSVALPDSSSVIPVFEDTATVAGWGRTAEEGFSSALLLDVEVPVRSDLVCNRVFDGQVDAAGAFCAGGEVERARDACSGDSGGPLLVKRNGEWVQAGIVNDGAGCARPGIPGVYTRLTHYVDWVVSTINSDFTLKYFESTEPEPGRFSSLNGSEPTTGSIQLAQLDVFDVTGYTEVTVRSLEGDADLHILVGDSFESSTVVCSSTSETSVDRCDIPDSGSGRVYAGVLGFAAKNSYSIAGSGAPGSGLPTAGGPSISSLGGGGGLWVLLHLLLLTWTGRRATRRSASTD